MPRSMILIRSRIGFTCSSYAPLPISQSFPTRRSSDLEMVHTRAEMMRALREELHNREYVEVETPMLQVQHGGAAARHRDRKSTRLNSSHVAISYAVFCLKKKNNESMWSEKLRIVRRNT